jgi:energy-coupling factor transporter ATP-binding protein EcfA2
VTIDSDQEAIERQLVTTIALPLLVHGSSPTSEAVVLHAAACTRAGEAVVVCGASGSGKSSLLVALIAAGWHAISEDMCVVDLRRDAAAVWPGPPWVRRTDTGPPGSSARFEAADKTAWDIAPWQVDEPQPLGQLVFLEPAGGDRAVHETVARPHAIAALARHTVWLGDQDQRSVATFRPCVTIAGAVPATRLRLPVSDSWLDLAVDALGAA